MAITGFLIHGQCYPTSAGALTALAADFPVISNSLLITPAGSSFTAPNAFTLTLRSSVIDSAVTQISTKSFSLVQCDPLLPVAANITPFDPVAAAAFWMWAMTMVLGCWLVANNAGLIVDFIKKSR
jgi:hypothetical protein